VEKSAPMLWQAAATLQVHEHVHRLFLGALPRQPFAEALPSRNELLDHIRPRQQTSGNGCRWEQACACCGCSSRSSSSC
jgi:hypothetical protein